jgi:release factor glutamine methyltransferase
MRLKYKNAEIKVIPEVYEPSEDSFLLAEAALTEIRGTEKVLEIGCGSGIISAVIKANTNATIFGIDINPNAVKCSKDNGIEVVRGDLIDSIRGKFDLLIFNPPYIPTLDEERTDDWLNTALDGGYDGRKIIFRFLEDAAEHLVENGRILLLISSITGIAEVKSKLRSLDYTVKDSIQRRYMFEQLLVIIAEKRKLY